MIRVRESERQKETEMTTDRQGQIQRYRETETETNRYGDRKDKQRLRRTDIQA